MSATTLQGSVSERTGSDVDFSVRNLWKVFGPNAHKVANDESLAGLSATGKPQWDLGGVSIEGSDVWVAGSGKTLAHFENGVMRVQTTTHPNEPGADLLRVWHRSANEWWAVGEAYLQRDAPAAGDWVVGRGAILRAFGLAGSENPATREPVLAIVGADGWLYKYDYTDPGTYPWQPPNYRPARLELRRDLRAIWLDGAAKGWAVGLDGQIISVDLENFAYARFETPTRDHLLGLWGTSVRKTWVVGGRSEGVILRSR